MVRRGLVTLMLFALGSGAGLADRAFRMGITPFVYDVTPASKEDTYARVNAHGDLAVHHVDDGVPWPEAYAGTAYGTAAEANIAERLAHTPAGRATYLAVTPLNSNRSDLAGYWGDSSNAPRPGEWADKDFDDPMVIAAYTNYCRGMIGRFHPAYFNYAIESLEFARNAPARWPKLMTLLRAVYPALKREFPALPIFVSITLRDPGTPGMTDYTAQVAELMAVSDYMAVSTYRYLFGTGAGLGNPANLPPRWLQQAAELAPGKPFAIAETGWLAETLDAPAYAMHVPGNATWQADYVRALFAECERLNARFLIWFLAVDYDRLYNFMRALGVADDSWLLWKDTGLWAGDLHARASLPLWDARLAELRRYVPPRLPDGWSVAGTEMVVARAADGALTVTWDRGTCPAPGHHLVWYDLHQVANYMVASETCSAGSTGTWTGAAPVGDVGVLAVADDAATAEGSYGVDSAGRERPAAAGCGFGVRLTDGACP